MFQRLLYKIRSFRMAGLLVALTILSGCRLAAVSGDQEKLSVFSETTRWTAFSTTSMAITGDISVTDTRLVFSNQASINLEMIDHDEHAHSTLFKVSSRINPELLNGNFLCGQQPVDYLVVQISGEVSGQSDMQLMAYYYPEHLRLADLPLKDKDDPTRMMCALFTYVSADSKPSKS